MSSKRTTRASVAVPAKEDEISPKSPVKETRQRRPGGNRLYSEEEVFRCVKKAWDYTTLKKENKEKWKKLVETSNYPE